MEDFNPQVIVAGGASIDWLPWSGVVAGRGPSRRSHDGTVWVVVPGGAPLLTEMPRHLRAGIKCGKNVHRVGSFGGCTGPAGAQPTPTATRFRTLTGRIQENVQGTTPEELASGLMRHCELETLGGMSVSNSRNLPMADRAEIADFRSLRNRMKEHLSGSISWPLLSLAMFGVPSARKFCSATQMARNVTEGLASVRKIGQLDFNLSRFRSPEDLCQAFRREHRVVLGGRMPPVFFDESDSAFECRELGRLRHFLEPMQDRESLDGEATHPIGRTNSVCAGGTHGTFEPGFVSQLLGYVKIVAFPQKRALAQDRLFLSERDSVQRSVRSTPPKGRNGPPVRGQTSIRLRPDRKTHQRAMDVSDVPPGGRRRAMRRGQSAPRIGYADLGQPTHQLPGQRSRMGGRALTRRALTGSGALCDARRRCGP